MINNLIKREMRNRIYTDHKNRIEEQLPNSGFNINEYKYVYEILNLIKYDYSHFNLYQNPECRIHRDYFQRITPNYKKYLDFLEKTGVILINKYYKKGDRSRVYVLNLPYHHTEENIRDLINKPHIETIEKTIIKKEDSIIERQKTYKKLVYKASRNNFESDMLKYFIEFISITDDEYNDMVNIAMVSDNNPIMQTKSVDNIYYQKLRFNHNNTNHRLDTNLTNLAKPIREYLMQKRGYDYMDIANSQPYILGLLLNYNNLS